MKIANFFLLLGSISLLCCCGGGNGNEKIDFDKIEVKKQVNIDPKNPSSPKCDIDISVHSAAKNGNAIGKKIDSLLIDQLFMLQGDLTMREAADSFANKYVYDYQHEFLSAYREASEDFKETYNFVNHIKTEVEKGRNDIIEYEAEVTMYEGGAHPLTVEILMNFDPKTGKLLTLKDVFKPDSEAKLKELLINKLLKDTGKKNLHELNEEGFLLNTDIYPSENFKFDDDEMVFLYNPYDIAPYVVGKIEIELDYDDIKDILSEDYR